MVKKLHFWILVIAMAAVLDGCGSAQSTKKPAVTPPQQNQTQNGKNTAPAITFAPQISHWRQSNGAMMVRQSYDYAPAVMKDGNKYRMWWCGGTGKGSDAILYSEADTLQGSWSTPVAVFGATHQAGTFDMTHTCDPSIIRVGTIYYMYYGGATHEKTAKADPDRYTATKIGVAQSADGIKWQRMNGGQPILEPAMKQVNRNRYGAGQPAALYINGYFYIMYTDTTGADSHPENGAGQYVVRSKTPAFENIEVLTSSGFAAKTAANETSHAVLRTFSVDMTYSDVIHKIIVATHNKPNQTTLHTLDARSFNPTHATVDISGPEWHDGPGLVRLPDGWAIDSSTPGLIAIDALSAGGGVRKKPGTWDLFWLGADLKYKSY